MNISLLRGLLVAFSMVALGCFPGRASAACQGGALNGVVEPGEDCEPYQFISGSCCTEDCTFQPEATFCTDYDECTEGDACDGAGTCVPEVVGCDDGDPCTMNWCGMGGCTYWPSPTESCDTGDASTLVIRDEEFAPGRSSMRWKVVRGPGFAQSDLGDPVETTAYRFCLFRYDLDYQDYPAYGLDVEPGPSWSVEDPKGATYKDDAGTEDGVTGVRLQTGVAGRSKIFVTAGGPDLGLLEHFDSMSLFEPGTGLVVQLHNMESGKCWRTDYPSLRRNNSRVAKAKLPE